MTFTILQTRTTPLADFKDGYLLIKGKSVPFDHPEFYDTLQERLNIYAEHPQAQTTVDFTLTAINAVSKRSIVDTFRFLEGLEKGGTHFKVNWYYDPDNEDIFELGEICQNSFDLDIDLHIAL